VTEFIGESNFLFLSFQPDVDSIQPGVHIPHAMEKYGSISSLLVFCDDMTARLQAGVSQIWYISKCFRRVYVWVPVAPNADLKTIFTDQAL